MCPSPSPVFYNHAFMLFDVDGPIAATRITTSLFGGVVPKITTGIQLWFMYKNQISLKRLQHEKTSKIQFLVEKFILFYK
jgi:hypothetical protein